MPKRGESYHVELDAEAVQVERVPRPHPVGGSIAMEADQVVLCGKITDITDDEVATLQIGDGTIAFEGAGNLNVGSTVTLRTTALTLFNMNI